jgi:hypothetical protein
VYFKAFYVENSVRFCSAWSSTPRFQMYVFRWLFVVRSLKWDQQSSMYSGWWYFCGCRWILSIFVFLYHFKWKIPFYFAKTVPTTHKLWMYVFTSFCIVRSLKWDQQSSMCILVDNIFVVAGGCFQYLCFYSILSGKFRPILPVLGLALQDFGCMYLPHF